MEKNKKALLVGAGGLIGKTLLTELLNSNYYDEVEVWLRKPLGIIHQKLKKEKIIDFSKIAEVGQIDPDHVFCCLGTTIKKAKSKGKLQAS